MNDVRNNTHEGNSYSKCIIIISRVLLHIRSIRRLSWLNIFKSCFPQNCLIAQNILSTLKKGWLPILRLYPITQNSASEAAKKYCCFYSLLKRSCVFWLQTPFCPPGAELLEEAIEVFRCFLTWPEPYSSVCRDLLSTLHLELKAPGRYRRVLKKASVCLWLYLSSVKCLKPPRRCHSTIICPLVAGRSSAFRVACTKWHCLCHKYQHRHENGCFLTCHYWKPEDLQNQKAEAIDLFKFTERTRGSAENTATNVKECHLCKNSFRAWFHALSPQILSHNIKLFPVFAKFCFRFCSNYQKYNSGTCSSSRCFFSLFVLLLIP